MQTKVFDFKGWLASEKLHSEAHHALRHWATVPANGGRYLVGPFPKQASRQATICSQMGLPILACSGFGGRENNVMS